MLFPDYFAEQDKEKAYKLSNITIEKAQKSKSKKSN